MFYGIKIDGDSISLREFKMGTDINDNGYTPITKSKYHKILQDSEKYPYGKYSTTSGNWLPETGTDRKSREELTASNIAIKLQAKQLEEDNKFIERYNRLKTAGSIT